MDLEVQGDKMNRKQKLIQAYKAIADKAVDAHLEYKTTFFLTGAVLALEAVHAKVNYQKFREKFVEMYPEVLNDPYGAKQRADDIAGFDLEVHWGRGDEDGMA